MKTTIIAIVALIAGFGIAFLLMSGDGTTASSDIDAATHQYTCGMHPEIVADEPGYCPICEMKLTPKKNGTAVAGSISIDPTTSQNMGLVTAAVSRQTIARQVRAFGKVKIAEPLVHRVSVKFEGWIERLYVDREGDRVFRGQPLFEIYSPDLVATQREYLVALGGGPEMSALLDAAGNRLANWDISDDQIEQLKTTGEPVRTLKVRAEADGIVTGKWVTEGDRVRPGMDLYEIVDLSSVWVVAQVYEQDLPYVQEGQHAQIEFRNLGSERYDGMVAYVAPYLDSRGQVEVRLDVDNFDHRLKPEMYAEVTLISALPGERLAIPRAAVINSGARQIAYTAEGDGKYRPRQIVTGAVGGDDFVEVHSGLDAGDQVVVSGQFLLDSESRLSEALATGVRVGEDHSAHSMQTTDKSDNGRAGHTASESGTAAAPASQHDHNHSGVYTCPMPSHFDVLQYGEGKCDKCGMALVPVEDTDNKNVYVCPMDECQVASHEPGRCPKCNMNLQKLDLGDSEESAEEPRQHGRDSVVAVEGEPTIVGGHDVYTCPMPSHYHVLQYGEGNCAECGMKLAALAETDNEQVYVCPMSECETAQDHKGSCPVCGMHLKKYQPEKNDDR